MITPLLFGLALAAIGTVVVHCIARLTDPEPTYISPAPTWLVLPGDTQDDPDPTFAAKYAAHIEQAQRRLRVEDFDAEAVEAYLTLPVEIPSQRRESRWS